MTEGTEQVRSIHAGHTASAFRLLRSGRVRLASAELAVLGRRVAERAVVLDQLELAEHAALRLQVRLATGDIAGALEAGDALAPYAAATGPEGALAHLALGELADAQGDPETALGHYLAAGLLDAVPDAPPWRAGATMALVRLGRRKEATTLARDLLVAAERDVDAWTLAIALRTVATADATADPFRTLRRARETAALADDARLTAQIDTDLAGLLVLVPAGDSLAEAIGLLRRAERYAGSEGLWPLHSRIARLLERAGERARPLEGEALAVLTSAEQRVARLAAQGLTNRQIAEELTVTVKGVEWHLSRVYRKLGISSRAGLGSLLDITAPSPRIPA